jgi:hypothetical protein
MNSVVDTGSSSSNDPVITRIQPDLIVASVEDEKKNETIENIDDLIERIKKEQRSDSEVMRIKEEMKEKTNLVETKIETYLIQDDILYKRVNRVEGWKLLLFVPTSCRTESITICHNSIYTTHNGATRTEQRYCDRFYFPGYHEMISSYVRTCDVCAMRKSSRHTKSPLMDMGIVTRPMQRIGMDSVGPYNKTAQGNTFMLTIIDYYTKYAWAIPISEMTTEVIMKKFMSEIVCTQGAPEVILTDRGTPFISELAKAIYEMIESKKVQTTAYHPQTNGLVERFHRHMNDMLACVCKDNEKDWDENIPFVMMSYNSAKQNTTGFSPHYMMYGREIKMPVDHALNDITQHEESYSDVQKYVQAIAEKMQYAKDIVTSIQEGTSMRRNEILEKTPRVFRVGELVMRLIEQHKRGTKKKLEPRYEGPYEVIEELSAVVRVIKKIGTAKRKIVNVRKLKTFIRRKHTDNVLEEEIKEDDNREIERQNEILRAEENKTEERKQIGEKRLAEIEKERKRTQEPVWKLEVPAKIAWNEEKSCVCAQDELVVRLREFYRSATRPPRQELEQLQAEKGSRIMLGEKSIKQMNREEVLSEIAKELRAKLE